MYHNLVENCEVPQAGSLCSDHHMTSTTVSPLKFEIFCDTSVCDDVSGYLDTEVGNQVYTSRCHGSRRAKVSCFLLQPRTSWNHVTNYWSVKSWKFSQSKLYNLSGLCSSGKFIWLVESPLFKFLKNFW